MLNERTANENRWPSTVLATPFALLRAYIDRWRRKPGARRGCSATLRSDHGLARRLYRLLLRNHKKGRRQHYHCGFSLRAIPDTRTNERSLMRFQRRRTAVHGLDAATGGTGRCSKKKIERVVAEHTVQGLLHGLATGSRRYCRCAPGWTSSANFIVRRPSSGDHLNQFEFPKVFGWFVKLGLQCPLSG